MRWSVSTVLSRTEHHQSGTDVLTSVGKYAQGDRFSFREFWDDVNCNYVEHASILNPSGGEIESDYVYDDELVSQRSRSQRATLCLILWDGGQRSRALFLLSVYRDFCTFSSFFLMYTFENLQIYLLFTFPFRVTPRLDRCCSRHLGLQLKTKSTSTHHCLPRVSSRSFC